MSEPRTEVSVGRRLMDTLQRPFRSIVSLRTKLALIIVAAIFAAAGFQMFGYYLNVPYFVRPFIMAAAAFVVAINQFELDRDEVLHLTATRRSRSPRRTRSAPMRSAV